MPEIISDENGTQHASTGVNNDDNTTTPPTTMTAPFIITDSKFHTMRASLFPYIQQKIHQDLLISFSPLNSYPWKEIIIRPLYTRHPPHSRLANFEKSEIKFNWHRPTTTILGSDKIAVNCFPGLDYTGHYASLVASYLALTGIDDVVVRCTLPDLDGSMCRRLFEESNLREMGTVDVVVLGYVYHLAVPGYKEGEWETGEITAKEDQEQQGEEEERVVFSWRKRELLNGKTVAFLACMPSFWGDISYWLVRALHQFNMPKCVIYLGKAGSLSAEIAPNEWLVTGDQAYNGDELITWENVLGPECVDQEKQKEKEQMIAYGPMVTVSSPLCESFEWLEWNKGKASWVDCEVGHMARACKETGTDFGYLHIISDNVSGTGSRNEDNLANEHMDSVKVKRRRLFDEIQGTLDRFLHRYGQVDKTEG